MNVRKPTDYSAMYAALDTLMAAALPQMELYCEIGHTVSARLEKGAAVAAAEYLKTAYPDAVGFSPRNLRRMRDFYRAYENIPEVMAEAMTVSWTQNMVILEAELTLQEKAWYIRAVQRFGWSKLALAERIASSVHLKITLDIEEEVCYSKEKKTAGQANDPCAENHKTGHTPDDMPALRPAPHGEDHPAPSGGADPGYGAAPGPLLPVRAAGHGYADAGFHRLRRPAVPCIRGPGHGDRRPVQTLWASGLCSIRQETAVRFSKSRTAARRSPSRPDTCGTLKSVHSWNDASVS